MRAFDDLPDPLGRLEELEIITSGHALCLEHLSEQIREQSQLGVKISGSLLEIIKYVDIASSKIRELEYRIEQLESK
jgi:uncharacterized coiled-coil protein SlyX